MILFPFLGSLSMGKLDQIIYAFISPIKLFLRVIVFLYLIYGYFLLG